MTEMTEDSILYQVNDGIAVVTLNRPDRMNAMTAEMGRQYNRALISADNDPDVVVVVLTGAGKGFCGGAELAVVSGLSSGEHAPAVSADDLRPSLAAEIRKPVIAAVNGSAAGVGLALMCYADLRFLSQSAALTTRFARLGLVAEYGLSWQLPRLVGRGAANDLLLSGRRVTGEEAGRIGLADWVLPSDEVLPAAMDYARDLAENCAPQSLATIKRQINADQERSFAEAFNEADALMQSSFSSPDLAEAVLAGTERRRPVFRQLEEGPHAVQRQR